jgi:hypothetical protein
MAILDARYQCHTLAEDGSVLPLGRQAFAEIVASVKQECKDSAEIVIAELNVIFPDVDLLNALGVIFPQYWMDPNCHELFPLHLEILTDFFSAPKTSQGEGGQSRVNEPLNKRELLLQMPLFKSTMISNSKKMFETALIENNPLSVMWKKLAASGILTCRISEWFKLAEIAVVSVIGSVEDERTFSTLTWMKSKVRNRLNNNLDCTLRLHNQPFYTWANFPFSEAISHWESELERRGVGF